MRAEQPDRREVDEAGGEPLEDDREAAGRPRDLDVVIGLVLREGEGVAAVGEERGVAGPQVHVAGVELGEMRDEQRRRAALAGGQGLHPGDELGVGEATEGPEEVRLHVGWLVPHLSLRCSEEIVRR
jgi:hypothetical protein